MHGCPSLGEKTVYLQSHNKYYQKNIRLRSLTAIGGKYSSQCSALANLVISSSFRPRDLMMSHWKVAVPDLATALL
ncbi:hypothetical protein EYF80_049530 [Liparis tanakae]|uniref:Uncharacterized protein n=1 Tax=Liparis tanakae TaxID=230148 RepID=A0A4Z2FHC4_9TELE|nr:hypothetical protein EYF80_049530 [Liparis tanakae]